MIESKGLKLRIVTECGRYITGPAGMLVSRVTHRKKIYKNYASCLQGGVLKLQMGWPARCARKLVTLASFLGSDGFAMSFSS